MSHKKSGPEPDYSQDYIVRLIEDGAFRSKVFGLAHQFWFSELNPIVVHIDITSLPQIFGG